MKDSIEYLGNVNSFTTREELYNIGKRMQLDAYNEAINDAANIAYKDMRSFIRYYNSLRNVVKKNQMPSIKNYRFDFILKLLKS